MQGKTNNYAKLTKLGNIIQWQREKNVTKRRQVQFVDEKRKRTSLQSELFYSSLNTSLSRYFSLISPKISFKYNSITLGKHISNPKPVLKIPNTHRTMPLRQGLSFISNAAGHGGVAPLQDRAKLCQWSASAAPQQVEEQFPFSAVCAVHQCVCSLTWTQAVQPLLTPQSSSPQSEHKDTSLPRAGSAPCSSIPFYAAFMHSWSWSLKFSWCE